MYLAALEAILGFLEKGLKAAVNAVAAAVQGAISAAKAAIAALAMLAALVKDIAAGPVQWISNFGAAIMDGIRNHLWTAMKAAIKGWFNAKLDSVLGIGTAIWDVLTKGAVTVAQVGQMAFEALKAAIPMMLIEVLVEKLAALIAPAVGGVMIIIEGLQAAWGSVSAILAAISKFMTFLKAVKSGNAGPQFANAVAAGAVAVIDFLSNFLLAKLMRPARKVGSKVKAMASRIMATLKKVGQKIGKAAKKVVAKIKKGAKKLGLGKKRKGAKKSRTKKDKEKAEDRLNKAMHVIAPAVQSMARKGTPGLILRAKFLYWKTRFRLSRVAMVGSGADARLVVEANPKKELTLAEAVGRLLIKIVHSVVDDILARVDVQETATFLEARTSGSATGAMEGTAENPIELPAGVGWLGLVEHSRGKNRGPVDTSRHYKYGEAGAEQSVSETRGGPFKPGPTNALVQGAGTYPEIAADLKGLVDSTGMSQAAIADSLREFARTGELPRKLKRHAAKMSSLALLMFGREGIRNPYALAQAQMTTDLLARGPERGGITVNQAFASEKQEYKKNKKGEDEKVKGTGGGLFPMSMTGAADASRTLQKRPGSDAKAAKELRRREAALIEKFVVAELGAKALVFKNVAEAEAKLEARVRPMLEERFRYFFNIPEKAIKSRPK
jgi:hypothetical protein